MITVNCELSPHIEFRIPYEIARRDDIYGEIVSLFTEPSPQNVLTARWDDVHLQFISNGEGVSFPWSKVKRVFVDTNWKVMDWTICIMDVHIENVGLPILVADKKYEAEFLRVIRCLQTLATFISFNNQK